MFQLDEKSLEKNVKEAITQNLPGKNHGFRAINK